ncbi:MAG: hypothetical protein AAGC71_06425 [Pseudomonadota bacterium]
MRSTDKRLQRTLAICDALVDLEAGDRRRQLAALTRGDMQLRRCVEALLVAIDRSGNFLEPNSSDHVIFDEDSATYQLQDRRVSRNESGKS